MEEGAESSSLDTPYSGTGAQGVNNLASRLSMVLLPPNRSPFRLRIQRKIIDAYAGDSKEQKANLLTEMDNGLARIEKEITNRIETLGDRTEMYSALIHLIIGGNVLLNVLPEGMRVFPLRSYVVKRDPEGAVMLIIVKEEIAEDLLPKEVRRAVKATKTVDKDEINIDEKHTHEIYTCIRRVGKQYVVYQECEDIRVGSAGIYNNENMPWLPLRLYRAENEDYGRGYVEQYYGTLHSLEILSKAINEGSAAASKVVFLVHLNSTTKPEELAKADNLSFVPGNRADIDTMQVDKMNDMQVAKAMIDNYERKMAKVFLMNTAIQRDAERVTAEEIRYMAQELETALGGLYSVLGKEFQRPYINLRIYFMQKQKRIAPFPKGVEPEIVTGIDALGRGQDVNSLTTFATTVFKLMPEAAMQFINAKGYLKTLAAAMGVDDSVVLKSDEQLKQEQAQAAEAKKDEMLKAALPQAVNAGGKILQDQMKPQEAATNE